MKPFLPATFAVALLLVGCGAEGTVTSARFVDSPSGVQLEYTLTTAHMFLAEYHRTLRVVFGHTQIDVPLEMDTGGYLLMNIDRLPDGRLMLFDGLAHIVIDPQRETAEQGNAPANASAVEYIGCFDWPQNGALGFISAIDRPERKQRESGAQGPTPSPPTSALLLDCDAFREVARFVYVAPQLDGEMIGEQLQRNDGEDRADVIGEGGDGDNVSWWTLRNTATMWSREQL